MRAALTQAGLKFGEGCVQYGAIDPAATADMMRRILQPKVRPTAVVATNDVSAVRAMKAC
jgi:DNA-binding LacI/PurR family transcriptional regulator